MMTWGWGLGMALGPLMMLGFWVVVLLGVVALVRGLAGTSTDRTDTRTETALEILQRRYAAGEITRDEYDQMRGVLAA
jgi:putative membrane protein